MKKTFILLGCLAIAGMLEAQDNATKNRLAIMPFHYTVNDQSGSEDVVYQIQADAFSELMKHHGDLILQDPDETNAKLFKAGITLENVRGYTAKEICDVLGIEYLVSGSVTQRKSEVSSTSSSTTVKETQPTTNNKGKQTSSGGVSATSSSSTYTSENYTTKLTLKIQNDRGESLFADDHQSVWSGPEAYKNAFRFLWKKSPLYTK